MRVWSLILAVIISLCSVQGVSATSSAQHGKHPSKKITKKTYKKSSRKSDIWSGKTPRKRPVDDSGIQVPAQITSKEQLEYVLNRIIASSDTNGASIGVFIKSLKSGEVLSQKYLSAIDASQYYENSDG